MRLARHPYDIVATQAGDDGPGRAAGLEVAGLDPASPTTPTKPIARPSTRSGVSRSFSHSQAMTAPNSGVAALKIADRPAVIDSSA